MQATIADTTRPNGCPTPPRRLVWVMYRRAATAAHEKDAHRGMVFVIMTVGLWTGCGPQAAFRHLRAISPTRHSRSTAIRQAAAHFFIKTDIKAVPSHLPSTHTISEYRLIQVEKQKPTGVHERPPLCVPFVLQRHRQLPAAGTDKRRTENRKVIFTGRQLGTRNINVVPSFNVTAGFSIDSSLSG